MATTKKDGAGRPKISSSHARSAAAGGAKKGARAPGKPSMGASAKPKRTAKAAKEVPARPKRPATPKPSRAAARSAAIAAAPAKPRRATTEVRSEAAEASKALALLVAKAALDKKALNVQIVDVVGRVDYTDFLVVMSGRSDRHVLSIADAIEEELVKQTPKRKPIAVEGRPQGTWVILDFGEVVAHVFQEDARSFYDLDTLWQDARKVPVAEHRPLA
ncbi:MAG: ribosome silencing factor [Deltaproteobacteria bacterium]|nr:ribosome silencing factor [Deltaproteobacteria bacterium]